MGAVKYLQLALQVLCPGVSVGIVLLGAPSGVSEGAVSIFISQETDAVFSSV